jgi:hypothetical protein
MRVWLPFLLALGACRTGSHTAPTPDFRDWSPAVFEAARQGDKLVLLDLGTAWCHWCHVMERTTYADAEVRTLLATHFVAAAADADRRPDLATRYQDYGWPATIVFDADGRELWKARGYLPPAAMRAALQALADTRQPLDDQSEPAASTPAAVGDTTQLTEPVRTALRQRLQQLHDPEHGGFGRVHKFLDLAGAEWLLLAARRGEETAWPQLRQWLDAELALHDPVWGGVYQYSHGGVWTNPHYEKVMSRQLADLRAYSLAYGAFGRPQDLTAARRVANYLTTMLAVAEGPFRASQDADLVPGVHAADYFARDDRDRRRLGVPRIEPSLWSRENGQALQGLCSLLAVDRQPELLQHCVRCADWLLANRRRPDGLFRHGDDDRAGPFLADSLEMTAALLALAEVTAEPRWLRLAQATLTAADAAFRAPGGGHFTAVGDGILPVIVDRQETLAVARVAMRLHHATLDQTAAAIATHAFAHVASPSIALAPGLSADLLLAEHERTTAPTHVVVVAAFDDPTGDELFAAALRHAPAHRLIERVEPGHTDRLGNTWPTATTAAAVVCSDGVCSAPIADPRQLAERLSATSSP